ncbi:MAG TPA: c-type cytochrome [Phaeodactylibacter sp.]|nr:c-type cytochrome [Phaeodactylibacter sp.]
MKKFIFLFFLLSTAGTLFIGCQKATDTDYHPQELNLPDVTLNYVGDGFPNHFSNVLNRDNTPDDNTTTNEGATLGRVLFYDTQLSLNNTVSCGTCHIQSKAFSDGKTKSPGFAGNNSSRNTLSIVNPRFATTLTWTGQNISLEEQVLQPIGNHLEMGLENYEVLADKLQKIDYYPALFEKAFGTTEITPDLIAKGLAQFLRSMQCSKSKYDQGFSNDFANLNPMEKMGKELFESVENGCSNCHRSVNFYYGSEVNIGLALDYEDEGKGDGRFRIPSLRNVALTAPYMHDGSLKTLEDVVEHYNSGVQNHPALDWRLKGPDGAPKKLNLTPNEKQALVAFLKTLTDENFVTNEKWSSPFK